MVRASANPRQESVETLRKLVSEKNRPINMCTQMHLLTKLFGYIFFKDIRGLVVKTSLYWALNIIILLQYVSQRNNSDDPAIKLMNKFGLLFMLMTSFFFGGLNALTTLFID